MPFNRLLCTSLLCLLPAGAALAQDNFTSGVTISDGDAPNSNLADLFVEDNTVLNASTCMGRDCDIAETFESTTRLAIKDIEPGILLEDTSPTGFPNGDWRIRINENLATASGGLNKFTIRDATNGTTPFTIASFAPDNTFYVSGGGNIGFGTMLPQSSLHIVRASKPQIRLQEVGGGGTANWVMQGSDTEFTLFDFETPSLPLRVLEGAESSTLLLGQDGRVGVGLDTFNGTAVAAKLEVAGDGLFRGDDATMVVRNSAAAPAARELLRLENNGGSYMTLDNQEAGKSWFIVHENADPHRFIIADGVNDGPELELSAGGDLTVQGNFISGATTLNVPDYVFGPDYALRPLAEVAAFIGTNRHLPEVPSAAEIAAQGLDMTDMQMALLKKVEELTLYTLEQEDRIARLEAALAGR
ncbi:hypothetical protein DU478_20550 [Thalassococcus profundi]|mgnify:CR=1 FL=1|uniref:Uncharacterized protein n=1 Tax=Thalassococcus profundi TaxID=2282382 RepID=A0A369TGA3_9RHOB|nr:hypothetical protein [Thalassococcus profundi]RDD64389.1 hypothetical protein DU478_20550 [Thalassococcus profundi]